MTFYATRDSEDYKINERADISRFETREEAEAFLLESYEGSEWQGYKFEVTGGEFGDCWFRLFASPDADDNVKYGPFARGDMIVRAPGTHPGGNFWWIEPEPEVLIIRIAQAPE